MVYGLCFEYINDATNIGPSIEIGFAFGAEFHDACYAGKKGVIVTDADAAAGKYLCAALADDYFADANFLPVRALKPEILGVRIPKVFSCPTCFCCRHMN